MNPSNLPPVSVIEHMEEPFVRREHPQRRRNTSAR